MMWLAVDISPSFDMMSFLVLISLVDFLLVCTLLLLQNCVLFVALIFSSIKNNAIWVENHFLIKDFYLTHTLLKVRKRLYRNKQSSLALQY